MRIKSRSYLIIILWFSLFGAATLISSPASALSGNQFQAGRIIDDAVFYNPNALDASSIQDFLNAKVPECDTNGIKSYSSGTSRAAYGTSRGYPPPYICLKDYRQDTPERLGESGLCGYLPAQSSRSAAQIIDDVAKACGVSQKVLIVLLQKEQSLITDDWPWQIQYRSATGYGCPDTAPCDAEYYGFFNQVYSAARQFKRYRIDPDLFNYRAGRTNFIHYHPDLGRCSGSMVYIENQATAGLYNYTPYQPNAAALNNLYGTGDSCSAYGNRNFWRMFSDWFGNTTGPEYVWRVESQLVYADTNRTQRISGSDNGISIAPGQQVHVTLKALNFGRATWTRNMRLATSSPRDRSSQFQDAGWMWSNRVTHLVEQEVRPGEIGTFNFTLTAPSTPGSYSEYFSLVDDSATWLNDVGMYIPIRVVVPREHSGDPQRARLEAGGKLNLGESIISTDGLNVLRLERNGNLVLYSNFKKAWSTNTANTGVMSLVNQSGDGNIVLYKPGGIPVWSFGSEGPVPSPSKFVLQNDGNLVLYRNSGEAIRATATVRFGDTKTYVNTALGLGHKMFVGQRIQTYDRKYALIFQGDGNLVLYKQGGTPLWSSGTHDKSADYVVMQSDGNLVIYDSQDRPLWGSGTNGLGPSRIVMQSDGNLVIYQNANNIATWSSGTYGR